MPFVANTPESLLARSDSKDPKSTCRGITSAGRPCRRPLAQAASHDGFSSRRMLLDPSDEALYCWQHKEQASHSAASSPGPKGTMRPIREERTSLDSLADRLGLVDLKDKNQQRLDEKNSVYNNTASNRDSHQKLHSSLKPRPRPKPRPKPASQLQFCFCFTIPIDEVPENPRPRPHQPPPTITHTSALPSQKQHALRPPLPSSPQHHRPSPNVSASSPGKQPSYRSDHSQTAQWKDLIPDSLDAATASSLMAELGRPLPDSEEAGYIYMFWLTPESKSTAAPVAAARSLLSNNPPSTPTRPSPSARRASDAVSDFAGRGSSGTKATMLLKIGRAANVQRRMNQWQRQCGYDVEVLRYYPQLNASTEASANPASGDAVPLLTPHCRRVERLVHIELTGLGLRKERHACSACGREHREWFQVDASREGIRRVDEVIRRWIAWDVESARPP